MEITNSVFLSLKIIFSETKSYLIALKALGLNTLGTTLRVYVYRIEYSISRINDVTWATGDYQSRSLMYSRR